MKKFIGHIHKARAAFTLMEVNLAIFIMAVGVLAMTSLYPLGFRESEQSRDDVRAAIVADQVLGKLTAALSSRNITWDKWESAVENAVSASSEGQQTGWLSYFTRRGTDTYVVKSRDRVNAQAEKVFSALAAACSPKPTFDTSTIKNKFAYGIVVQWGKRVIATGNGTSETREDRSRVSISFRLARRSGALMTAPIYYTEVHFQGDQDDQREQGQ